MVVGSEGLACQVLLSVEYENSIFLILIITLSHHCFGLHVFSGKTTLLSVLAHGEPVETVPTIGLNVKVFKKGNVSSFICALALSSSGWHLASPFL